MPLTGGTEERIADEPRPGIGRIGTSQTAASFFIADCPGPNQVLRFPNAPNNTGIQTDGQERYWTPGISASRNGRTIYYAVEYQTQPS